MRGAVVMAALSAAIIHHADSEARAEAWIASAQLPPPDSVRVTQELAGLNEEEFLKIRNVLEHAVRHRPNWAEGRLRLGLIELGLYRLTASDWLADSVHDPEERARLADPLWLLTLIS